MRGSGSAEWQQFQLSGSNGELHCPTRLPSQPDIGECLSSHSVFARGGGGESRCDSPCFLSLQAFW